MTPKDNRLVGALALLFLAATFAGPGIALLLLGFRAIPGRVESTPLVVYLLDIPFIIVGTALAIAAVTGYRKTLTSTQIRSGKRVAGILVSGSMAVWAFAAAMGPLLVSSLSDTPSPRLLADLDCGAPARAVFAMIFVAFTLGTAILIRFEE